MKNVNRRVSFDCFWRTGCSDSVRCNANGTCVAAAQAGGATFPQQMQPDNRPLSHMEILSAVAHYASEIARLTAAIPVQCKPDETQPLHPSLLGLSRDQQTTLIEHLWEASDGCEPCAVRFRNLRVGRPVEPSPAQHATEYFGKKLLETNEERFQVTPGNKP